MDKQSSKTKGSHNDFKSTYKSDKSTPPSNYQESFEFLDMSFCDEAQKLKLKNTLEMPLFSAVTSMPTRERFRSNNFVTTRNTSLKSQQYHLNSSIKSQKPSHGSNSTRSFSSETSFSSKNNSNFNNNLSTNLNDNRQYSNTQDKISKWHNKKPTIAGIRESIPVYSKETSLKRTGGFKEIHCQQSKEVPRELCRNFSKNMSPPPLTNFQTNTTSTTTSSSSPVNQGNMPHQYGSHPQMYHPQMYPNLDHPNLPSQQHQHARGGGMGRRGRSRGGNSMNRRDFQVRQNNHQQNQPDYPMIDQNQGVMSSTPYQQIYFHYPPWQNTLPQNLNLTQNLTGQPLFAIQQPLLYQYGSHYPIMYNYNVMPQAHPMSHQQSEMLDSEVQEPIAWQMAHSQQIFQHSPHSGAEIEFQVHPVDEYHHENEYQPEEIEMNSSPNFVHVNEVEEEIYDEHEQIVIEKTRDLMIQTSPPLDEPSSLPQEPSVQKNENPEPAICEKVIDNKMIIKNVEKPPAWSNVPNLSAQQKKQMASVSVSAIPNKDVERSDTNVSFEKIDAESKPIANSFTFSASKQPITQAEGKKTENKQNEVQQMVLIERAKQQIVTTITGIGSNQENDKKVDIPEEEITKSQIETTVAVEKSSEPPKLLTTSAASVSASSALSRATWAGLFNSKPDRVGKTSPQLQNLHSETQKPMLAKNSEPLLAQTPQLITSIAQHQQVPSSAMSYSAVSAQSLTPSVALNHSSLPQVSAGTKNLLPQSKLNLPHNINENENITNNNDEHVKTAPVDQHAMKLGDFFSKYKIEFNSVSLFPRGLLNKSNYCYINAILQALVSCPPFYHLMKAIPQMPSTYRNHTKTPVTDAMIELVSNYTPRKWTPREKGKKDEVPEIARDTAFEPTVVLRMLQALRTDMFPVEGRQEDAEEFLSFILNRMNDEMIELKKLVEKPKVLARKEENGDDVNGNLGGKNSNDISGDEDEWKVISGTRNKSTITRTTDFGRSPISDIFGGKLRLRVHREGDHSSDNIEPFFTLKLVIEKASSVREALDILVNRSELEGITCSKTNQEVPAWQQVTLEELPVVLILHLKCFDFKKDGCTKILKTVEFPVELKLDQKIMASKNKYHQKQKQYKLFAIVYHEGKEASKGHYITDVFHLSYSSWIRYDDSSVKVIPENNVLHPQPPRVPYLLFYRRFDTCGGQASKNSTK